jgi:hypothetical protein
VKRKGRILDNGNLVYACEVAASGIESGIPFSGNPVLIEELREAARILRIVDETGHISARRDGNWIVFQLPEDKVG